jgi:hypothetical protein
MSGRNKTRKRTRQLTPPRKKKNKTVKSNQSSYLNDVASFIFDPFLSRENQFKPKRRAVKSKSNTPKTSRPYSYVKQSPPKPKAPRTSRPYNYVKQSPPKPKAPRTSRPYSFKPKTQRRTQRPKNKTQKKKTPPKKKTPMPPPKKKTPTPPPKKKTPPARDNSPSWSKGVIDHNKAYKILGLTNRYTKTELKKAYMKLARKYHPDKNPQNRDKAARKFKQVKDSYDLLNGAFM